VDQHTPARPGIARADCKSRILFQAQCRRANGNIGCETFDWRRDRIALNTLEPLHIHKTFSEAEHCGNKRSKLLTRKKRLITKPAPTHTLRKHALDDRWCAIFYQAQIKYAFEAALEAILKMLVESRIELAGSAALHELNSVPSQGLEIARQKQQGGMGFEKTVLVKSGCLQTNKRDAARLLRDRKAPIGARRMHGRKEKYSIGWYPPFPQEV